MYQLMIVNYCDSHGGRPHDHIEYSPVIHPDRASAYAALMESLDVIKEHDPEANIYLDEYEDIIVGFEFFAADTDGGYVQITASELVPV